ncbi:MAG: ribose-phosphate pyrophosphokinase [Thermoplasmatales archaeon E-plasma]|nr:MAG: ribose-phosphate pyrophosphokinase [Thermoplasmatales archaeon E-plasma]
MLIVSTKNCLNTAIEICDKSDHHLIMTEVKRFPDGELYVRVVESVEGQEVLAIGNTREDGEALEFMLLLNALKENGASSVTAFLPYFGYARQHMIYKPGEAISSKVFTQMLSEYSDEIITINIHDNSTMKYSKKKFVVISMVKHIARYFLDMNIGLVVAPDDGAMEIASEAGKILNVDSRHLDKKRIDSITVSYSEARFDVRGKNILLIDDIISTGGTIKKSIKLLREMGANRIYVGAIHGIFINNSGDDIAGMCDELVVTDTIYSRYSKVKISDSIEEIISEVA